MGGSHGARKTVPVAGAEDQMDMVWHEAIGPDRHGSLVHLPAQDIAIDILIAVFEEDRLAAIAACGDVMGTAGNDNAGETGHTVRLAGAGFAALSESGETVFNDRGNGS